MLQAATVQISSSLSFLSSVLIVTSGMTSELRRLLGFESDDISARQPRQQQQHQVTTTTNNDDICQPSVTSNDDISVASADRLILTVDAAATPTTARPHPCLAHQSVYQCNDGDSRV